MICRYLFRVRYQTILIIVLLATLHFQSLNAQNLENPTDKQLDTLVNKNTEDSLFVSYHLYDKVAEKIELSDSVISQRVLKYGSKNIDFSHTIHLGTDGSAGLNLTYKPIISSGIILGYDQYDIYSFRHQDLKIFDANIPLTLLRFSFLGGLQNFNIGTIFHTPLSDGQSITLDYNRYKLLGLYNQQAVLSTNFALYYQFNSKSNAYSATFGFIRNSNTEQNNGGILPNQDYTTPFKETLTTFLTEDSTKQIDQNVFLDHKLRFTKSSEDKVEFGMYHNFQYYKKYVKFVDHNVSDSISLSYFGNLITDTRGLRRLTDISTIGNSFWLYGELGKVKGKVGIYHGFSTITDQSNIINRHDLTLLFDGNLPIRKLFNIKTTAAFGIGGNAGNFDLKGEVSLFSGKNIQLDGFLQLFRSDISYQDKRLILNTTEQYSTSFENPFGSILNGKLSVSKINLNLHVTQTIINNAIYRQENFVPDQLTSIFSHTQFSLENEFKLWKLHFVNALHYQVVSHNIYPVPTFFSNHMLYFRGKWFRQALEAHFGAGMRYINDLPSFTYQPAVGTFVPISQSVAHDFPNVNVFFMGRASVFWFKFSMENILGYINDLPDFQLVNYPVYDPKFRFTIMWKLRD